MENNEQQRTIVERIWNPATPKDEVLIRVFFWVSIIACFLISRLFEGILENKAGQAVIIGWIALAIFIRFRIFFRR